MTEKERIIQMVADGKISAEDAERLIRAIGETEVHSPRQVTAYDEKTKAPKTAKIVVDIKSAKGENVKFNVPIKLAKWVSKFIPEERLSQIEAEGINIHEILNNITEFIDEASGKDLVNIVSSSGDQVRVYLDIG